MFVDHIKHALIGAISSKENFPFTVKNEFLKVKCYRFGDAEIFCILGNTYFQLFTRAEEMVNGVPACKDDPCIIWNFNFLFAEITTGDALQPDKRIKVDLDLILPLKF